MSECRTREEKKEKTKMVIFQYKFAVFWRQIKSKNGEKRKILEVYKELKNKRESRIESKMYEEVKKLKENIGKIRTKI